MKKNNWIEQFFIDGKHIAGGILKAEIPNFKTQYRRYAQNLLNESGADHVVYCHIEYDAEGEITLARFYSGLKMDDGEFYKTTGELAGDHFVGAVHQLK